MPDNWDPQRYQRLAAQWFAKADSLPEGAERDACVALSEGYARLADLIQIVVERENTPLRELTPN